MFLILVMPLMEDGSRASHGKVFFILVMRLITFCALLVPRFRVVLDCKRHYITTGFRAK